MSSTPAFDHYYRYDELTSLLQAMAEAHPDLLRLESLGKSHEGRDIWLARVTRFETGPAEEKPALWVDGNIHAVEVATCSACVYLLNKLVTQYGSDPEVTRCLDTRAFYVVPRLNPDGAELALADRPKYLRSSTRPYPYDEEPIEGLIREDIDGDGRLLSMRLVDPNGAWKAHPEEPRLLIRRDPVETGGTYYRLLPEGRLENYDGVLIKTPPPKERLDLNRNFPAGWRPEQEQAGAGPFPASEPEVRAMVAFIVDHPNITGTVHYHTFSGVLLRPYCAQNDEAFPAEDLWTYQKIGEKGKEITGYPALSIYHDFRYHPKQVISGGTIDWLYDHRGVFAWAPELWSPQREAGITDYKYIDWWREHPVEDDRKLLRWSDEKLAGKGFVEWYPFDHPQLGPVELGSWHTMYAFANPPPAMLEREIAPQADWLIWQALISPRMELRSLDARPLGPGHYAVRLVLENTGWLPSYVTKKALERQAVRPVIAEIALPDGAALETGKPREELGQLEGKAYKSAGSLFGPGDATDERAKVEWVVRAAAGAVVRITARHERAGTVRRELRLP
jgi:murein tripeptide amidase MpaA